MAEHDVKDVATVTTASENAYYYDLPPELIAQAPVRPRDSAAMFVLHRATGERELRQVKDLPDYLDPDDVVVVNDTKVVPTVIRGRRATGGKITIRMVSRKAEDLWDCWVDTRRAIPDGEVLELGEDGTVTAEIVRPNDQGTGYLMRFTAATGHLMEALATYGTYFHPMHLPALSRGDEHILQTVYAEFDGSFQSPSAGLHVTDELISALEAKGIKVVNLTQHVGRLDAPGPLAGPDVHHVEALYEEWYRLPETTAAIINAAKDRGNRVLAIGTTVTRTLETQGREDGRVEPGSGWTTLFLKPGARFRVIDGLVSNFQSPKITTLILACAFAGTEPVMEHYREAVRRKLRFLEYGDAALYL